MVRDVYIVEAVRTPIGRRDGALKGIHPINLGGIALAEALQRARVQPGQVDLLVGGCITQAGEQSLNIMRSIGLVAGLPIDLPAITLDFQCGSSQQAMHIAADIIRAGSAEMVVALGVESMSRVPIGTNYSNGPGRPFTREVVKAHHITMQGIAAENIAVKYGIDRYSADDFGVESHRRAVEARRQGLFRKEIVPVHYEGSEGQADLDEDETPRSDTSMAAVSQLKPSFREDGIHHAGNSSQICDGAAAVVLASEAFVRAESLVPRARIVSQVALGSDPHLMLTGPITATPKALKQAGLSLDQMAAVEINEAFASVVLAWQKVLEPNAEIVNPNGGAIALGHPLGATGVRLITTLISQLQRTEGQYGLATMCCGGGLATATVVECLSDRWI